MAQPSNTYDTYDMVGIREDLSNIIYRISPEETPMLTMAAREKATARNHEWQIDALASAVATNAVIEGDDATTDAITATTRVGNYTQISDKVILLSGTAQVVNTAGRSKEMALQISKRGKELKLDIDTNISQNRASVAGNSTTARESGSFESWLTTNDDRGAGGAQGGASGSAVTAPTHGTQRAFTEAMMKTVLRLGYTSGAKLSNVLLGPWNKQIFSAFTGNATKQVMADKETLFAAIDLYVSDYGRHAVRPSRNIRDRSALFIDPDYLAVAYLRPFQTKELAKTGDSDRFQLLAEYTLVVRNEAAHGIVADLTPS